MTRVYYQGAVGAFVVFDATRQSTFEATKKWKTDIEAKVVLPNGQPIPGMSKFSFLLLIENSCTFSQQDRFSGRGRHMGKNSC